jgi:hypothetical protein
MDHIVRFYVTLSTLASERLTEARRNERGQGTIEYVGMVIVAAIIVLALLKTKMGDRIAAEFAKRIQEILDTK